MSRNLTNMMGNVHEFNVDNILRIKLKDDFFEGINISETLKEHAEIIIPGLLRGENMKQIAARLECEESSAKVFSAHIRTALGIGKNARFSKFVNAALSRRLKIKVAEGALDRINRLHSMHYAIVESSASSLNIDKWSTLQGLDKVQCSFFIKTAFEAAIGQPFDQKSGKTLLPATLLRAAQIDAARKREDFTLFPDTDVSFIGEDSLGGMSLS